MKGQTAAESFKLYLWCVEHLEAHAIWFRSLKENFCIDVDISKTVKLAVGCKRTRGTALCKSTFDDPMITACCVLLVYFILGL